VTLSPPLPSRAGVASVPNGSSGACPRTEMADANPSPLCRTTTSYLVSKSDIIVKHSHGVMQIDISQCAQATTNHNVHKKIANSSVCRPNNMHKRIKSLIHQCADQHNAQSNDTAREDWTYMVVLKIIHTCVNLVATSLLITGKKRVWTEVENQRALTALENPNHKSNSTKST
jgi:hypothetical protein